MTGYTLNAFLKRTCRFWLHLALTLQNEIKNFFHRLCRQPRYVSTYVQTFAIIYYSSQWKKIVSALNWFLKRFIIHFFFGTIFIFIEFFENTSHFKIGKKCSFTKFKTKRKKKKNSDDNNNNGNNENFEKSLHGTVAKLKRVSFDLCFRENEKICRYQIKFK